MSDIDEILDRLFVPEVPVKKLNGGWVPNYPNRAELEQAIAQEANKAKLAERQQKLVPVLLYAALWFTVGLFVGAAL